MVKIYIQMNQFAHYYFLTPSKLKKHIGTKYINDFIKNMKNDDTYFDIRFWLKSTRIKHPKYLILRRKDDYVASLRFHYRMIQRKRWCWISVVLVNPKYRRRGIAKKMLQLLQNHVKAPLCLRVASNNKIAIKLYKSLNFKIQRTPKQLVEEFKHRPSDHWMIL